MVNHPRRSKQNKTSAVAAAPAPRSRGRTAADHDYDYNELLTGLRLSFDQASRGQTRLFTTDTDTSRLWDTYLSLLPAGKQRQIHNCHCCRRFVEAYGGLVAIAATGEQWPVMWRVNGIPDFYKPAITALHHQVMPGRVTGVFLTKAETWGTPESNGKGYAEVWKHLSVVPAPHFLHSDRVLDPNQAAAAVRENFKTVMNALAEFSPAVLDETLRVLESGQLTRSEKFLGPVRWLRQLHDWPKGRENNKLRHNILWRAVALAPEGFCHIKSSVLGPLLVDVAAGVPFADIQRKFNAMLNPRDYQRPKAAPAEANVRAAEAIVEKLGIERSLHRRFARLDELPLENAFWVPAVLREVDDRPVPKASIFDHLKTRRESVPQVNLPTVTMTFDKFRREVLTRSPSEIEMIVPSYGPFFAMTTAEHEDAAPIYKWDSDEERNPFASYTYTKPTSAARWRLIGGAWAKVNAIVALPNMWGSRPQPHLGGGGAIVILEGCADTQTGQGNALFPESLINELHGARSTIEAYSKSAVLGGRSEASACGYGLGQAAIGITLRARIGGAWSAYQIDRWD